MASAVRRVVEALGRAHGGADVALLGGRDATRLVADAPRVDRRVVLVAPDHRLEEAQPLGPDGAQPQGGVRLELVALAEGEPSRLKGISPQTSTPARSCISSVCGCRG